MRPEKSLPVGPLRQQGVRLLRQLPFLMLPIPVPAEMDRDHGGGEQQPQPQGDFQDGLPAEQRLPELNRFVGGPVGEPVLPVGQPGPQGGVGIPLRQPFARQCQPVDAGLVRRLPPGTDPFAPGGTGRRRQIWT